MLEICSDQQYSYSIISESTKHKWYTSSGTAKDVKHIFW
jgi:hypothetical protein